jgi:hypothetical protein
MRVAFLMAIGIVTLGLVGCSQPEKPTADDNAFNSELMQAAKDNAGKPNPGAKSRVTKVPGAPSTGK